jgi:hypothetical protein
MTTTQEGTQMSAILELNTYSFFRELRTEETANVIDHVASSVQNYKTGEEDILQLAAKLVRYTGHLMVEVEHGQHAHDWITSVGRDLSAALAKREYLITDVKRSIYLLEKLHGEALAEQIRSAVWGA